MSVKIQLKEEETKGGAYVDDFNTPDAAMTYSIAGEDTIIIDHTEVSDKFRGQGVGRQLLDALVAKVRAENKKIVPVCPYVISVFERDSGLSDVLK